MRRVAAPAVQTGLCVTTACSSVSAAAPAAAGPQATAPAINPAAPAVSGWPGLAGGRSALPARAARLVHVEAWAASSGRCRATLSVSQQGVLP